MHFIIACVLVARTVDMAHVPRARRHTDAVEDEWIAVRRTVTLRGRARGRAQPVHVNDNEAAVPVLERQEPAHLDLSAQC